MPARKRPDDLDELHVALQYNVLIRSQYSQIGLQALAALGQELGDERRLQAEVGLEFVARPLDAVVDVGRKGLECAVGDARLARVPLRVVRLG